MTPEIVGVDTTWLVQVTLRDHPGRVLAKARMHQLVAGGARLGIAPQVLHEFIHVTTDPRRFSRPLAVVTATDVAERWWLGAEVVQLFPSEESVQLALDWQRRFELGRKRVLDTALAAIFRLAGVRRILSDNGRDFSVFGGFEVL